MELMPSTQQLKLGGNVPEEADKTPTGNSKGDTEWRRSKVVRTSERVHATLKIPVACSGSKKKALFPASHLVNCVRLPELKPIVSFLLKC